MYEYISYQIANVFFLFWNMSIVYMFGQSELHPIELDTLICLNAWNLKKTFVFLFCNMSGGKIGNNRLLKDLLNEVSKLRVFDKALNL